VRRRGLRALLPAALAVVACAHVEAFRADPVTVCAGDAVRVVWEAEQGAVRLDSDAELPGTGASAAAGSQVFTLRTDTRFTLLVDGLFRDDHAEADVVVTPEEGEQGYGEVATCDEAARAIHTTVRLSHQVSPLLRVEQVRNLHDRPLVVEKGGRSARATRWRSSPSRGRGDCDPRSRRRRPARRRSARCARGSGSRSGSGAGADPCPACRTSTPWFS